jgi:hypothetical protein
MIEIANRVAFVTLAAVLGVSGIVAVGPSPTVAAPSAIAEFVINRAFEAAAEVPAPSAALRTALTSSRGDRLVTVDADRTVVRTVTFESREEGMSTLVRLPILELAGR